METNTIEISKNRTSYLRKGDGEITLLMIHGNSLRKESFHSQLNSPLAEHIQMVAIDLPGHGDFKRNGAAETLYSIEGLVNFVTEFCQKMNFENLVMFGHSLGGHLAIEAASDISNLIGIIALGTPPLTSNKTTKVPFLENPAFPLLLQGELRNDQIEQLARSYWNKDQIVPEWISKSIRVTDLEFRSVFGGSVAAGALKDEVAEIKKLNFPVALAVGEKDALISRNYIQDVAGDIIWENSVQVIKGAGHSAQAEKPDLTNQLIFDYIHSF